ncbi:MAG: SpoIIE family protein phosphatase, partial [Bacteroidota bacterium]|nr:SpoIIE family protein phosphatase [Bacteroidota bacterium]
MYETYSDKTITGGYRKIASDKYGSVWFTTQSGVGKIEKNNIRFFKEENGLTDFEITSIKNDREGNIWFGMMGDGIYQYLGEAFINWDVENGLPYKVVQAILIDNKNNAWIGTEKGISIVSQNETVKSLFEKDGLTDNNIQALFQDSRNLIWIGTANGISVFDPSNEKIIKITKLQGLAANLSLTINEDKNGHIWTGSLGEGTSQIIMNGKKIVKVVNYYKQQGFASNAIWKIFKDSKGNLWFGTNDAGLIKYDGESFTTINSDDGLPNQRPGSITEDKQGNLWIGSIGGGVIKFNPLSNTFTSYTTQNGISSDNPYLVISDNENNIWVGTNYGIDRIDSNGKIKHFGKNEGFHGVETNQNAVALDGEGNIWFGTIKGVVKCNPSLLKENKEAPLIHIKKVRIFLKEEKLPAGNKFTYNKNHLTFDFVGISFANAEKVQYRYKLQGFDQEWQPLTSARFATYSNLEAGNYTFLIECKNNDGVWSNSPSTFNFIIAPPFWKTSWFYILITIIFIGIAYGFVLTRTHKLKQTKNKLEELVSFRTRELKQEKEKVEKVNKEVVIQKNIIELKNKDITDSINYAKRIQEAILPSLNVIEKGFKGLFFYYKPKDIVSGDFYWFSENGNSKTIAIADCTGHGVPGALMSIIGNNVLNEVISEKTVSSTGLALELLDGKIRHILKQNSNLNHTSEGMDIALINIDLAKMELCFSGAYRPLVLIREGNLVEYKGDKIAIGGYHENKKQFTDHVIKLEKNDIFYLFSDGYA